MAYQQEQRRGNDGPGARGLSSISRVDVALLLGLTIAAAVLYASNLTTVSLWSDEGVTARVMAMSPRHFALYLLFGEPSYIGYYLVLRPWVAIVGTSEAGLRSLSAACALGTVPLVYLIGRQLAASRLVAVGASALLVANAMVLHLSLIHI